MQTAVQIGKKCAHRRQVERQLSARYAAITSSEVTSERQLSARYVAIRASKEEQGRRSGENKGQEGNGGKEKSTLFIHPPTSRSPAHAPSTGNEFTE